MTKTKERYYSKGYYHGLKAEPRFDTVAKLFTSLTGNRLLDLGCGDGDITLVLKASMHASEAYGVDLSEEAVKLASEKGIRALHLDLDDEALPFENSFFDVVYCGEIIEHVFDPDHLLAEVKRVLKTSGSCIITTPNLAGWSSRFALLFGYQPYPMAASPLHESAGKLFLKKPQGQWGHIRVFTLQALKEIVQLHGFIIRKIIGCSVTVQTSSAGALRGIQAVDKLMSKFPSMSSRIIIVLEKPN